MHRRIRQMAGALLAMALASAPMPQAHADSVSSVLGAVNSLRISRGLTPLIPDPGLTAVAQQWSIHMAAARSLVHNPSLTTQVAPGWHRLGENIGVGANLNAIVTALVAEPAHLANMVDSGFTLTGIAVVPGTDGNLWVTQDFEELAGHPRPTPAPTAPPTTQAAPRPRPTTPTTAKPVPPPTVTAAPSTTVPAAVPAPIEPTTTSTTLTATTPAPAAAPGAVEAPAATRPAPSRPTASTAARAPVTDGTRNVVMAVAAAVGFGDVGLAIEALRSR